MTFWEIKIRDLENEILRLREEDTRISEDRTYWLAKAENALVDLKEHLQRAQR